LERRLGVHRLTTLDAYATYLAANPEEGELLFRELLIGVTHFFRDEDAFAVLAERGLPDLLANRPEPGPLRAWVAGCSTGEEAYSLAIAVHEAITLAKLPHLAIQIYATDIDASAIAVARAGQYEVDIAQNVSPERLARYFTRDDHGYRICKEIRDTVVFAEHDLIADPPFTRLDLLFCRNVLIYLQPLLQQRLLPQFHYALRPGGILVLGSSESVTAASQLFTPMDPRAKVFRSLDVARGPLARIDSRLVPRPIAAMSAARLAGELTVVEAARRAIVETIAPATVLINERGDILFSSRRTGRYLEPAVGKTNINIFAMARDGLGPHLSVAVRQAIAKRRRIAEAGLVIDGDRGHVTIDLAVVPLDEPVSLRGLLLVVFDEVPAARGAPRAKATRKAPAAIERELARTKAHLQMVVREMEASQAQVEATNDQLQSANEELQSTNEEVTTSKEELQSLNEELLTVNSELEAANHELATANDDLRNLLNSTKIPTLFLDGGLRIKRFTNEASRIANLLPSDVGRVLTDITLKVDYRALVADVREVLDTLVFKEVQAVGADGARYMIRIHPYRTMNNVIDGVVITFSDVTALRRAEDALAARAHDDVIARLLDRWPGMVSVRDLALERDVYLNDRARAWLRAASGETAVLPPFESLLHADDRGNGWRERLAALGDGEVIARRIHVRGPDGAYHGFRDRESVLARSAAGAPTRVLAVIEEPSSETP
ncbi:MAG: PAS domain-containing protein, partial [Deltaproteobacteria bacterium]|nr:PAS domain-containing protein [Deltaproteobacteria bacterium]